MIRYEIEHLLLCHFRDFKSLNSFQKQNNLEKILKRACSRRNVGTFSEQRWGDLEQGTEAPNVERACPGQLSHSDTSPSVIAYTCAHFMSM